MLEKRRETKSVCACVVCQSGLECVSMCVYTHIHTYAHIHTETQAHEHTHSRTDPYTHIHTC
jgi:hypothetical protein